MKKKNILFILILVCVTVMIHIGGESVFKTFERSHDGRVNVNIHQMGNLHQNSRSLHTSATGQFICTINGWEKDPNIIIGAIKGDLPILFYNDEKEKYGYVDRDGNVVIKEDLMEAYEFFDSGIAITSKGIIDTKGNIIVSGSESGEQNWNIYNMYFVDEKNHVIFCRCQDDYDFYIVSDFLGNKKAKISEEQFKDCINDKYSDENYLDTAKVKALKESLGMAEE